ncbi:metal ABC transporter permease [Vibrio sp. WXL210]|uniref:metal ABC transporter permease n=1 Tax=Vibrio sp. WXL210 TaxID=3450709 RepID=UPI003EC8FF8E
MLNDYAWLLPAFICGTIALIGNVILGHQVIKRGIIFIDLAVAQAAAMGAGVFHYWLGWSSELWFSDLYGPWSIAFVMCALIALIERYAKQHLEAMIGCLYVVSASTAMLMVSHDPHGADFIHQVLNGQLLWATWQDVVEIGVVTLGCVIVLILKPSILSGYGFYILFALLMPITVKLTGVYLEFALLVIPALCAAKHQGSRFYAISIAMGIAGILLGLVLSSIYDLPSGAIMVICLFVVGLIGSMVPARKIKLTDRDD